MAHWIERLALKLPGFRLVDAETFQRGGHDLRIFDGHVAWRCENRFAMILGPWGLAWLVGELRRGYLYLRHGQSGCFFINDRLELELRRQFGRQWHRLPAVIEVPEGQWWAWVDYEKGELRTAVWYKALPMRAAFRLLLWLLWGEPLNPAERAELDEAHRREKEAKQAYQFFLAALEQDPELN